MKKLFPEQQILHSSILKEFADDHFQFDGNGGKFFKWVENTQGKDEIAQAQAISPFPTVFSKDVYCRHLKTRACFGKGKTRLEFCRLVRV